MPPYWNIFDVSLMIRLVLQVFGRKIKEIKCHFHHTIPKVLTTMMIYDS